MRGLRAGSLGPGLRSSGYPLTSPMAETPENSQQNSRRWSLLRHPTERQEGRGRFDSLAEAASNLASSGAFFSLCVAILFVWILGLIFGFAAGTESALTGTMSAVTLLLVALLKNSELRADRAMQLKLDAIASALLEDRGSGPEAEGEKPIMQKVVFQRLVGNDWRIARTRPRSWALRTRDRARRQRKSTSGCPLVCRITT